MGLEEKLSLLNAQIAYARANSAFYSCLPEEPLRSMDELGALPLMDQRDLTEHGNELLCVSPGDIRRMVTLQTSGTTDVPKRIAFTEADLLATVAFFRDGMRRLTGEGQKIAIFMPGSNPDGLTDLLSRGIRAFGAVPILYGAIEDYQDAAVFLHRERPDFAVGFPVQMRHLALTAPEAAPVGVLLSADYCAESVTKTIERAWNCRVYLHYGMTETCFGGAVETPEKRGMIPRDDLIFEELPDGEIAVTTLGREGMPLIRYRTGDFGTVREDGSIASVGGRIAERDRPVSVMKLDELLFSDERILDYEAFLSEKTLRVSLLTKENCETEALRDLQPRLEHLLENTNIFVRCELVPEICFRGKRSIRKASDDLTIFLIRHAEPETEHAGAAKRCIGSATDPALSERGRVQARELARRFEKQKIDAVWTSPLKRAKQTAEAVSAACGCPLTICPDLREMDAGVWDGLTFEEIKSRYPEEYKARGENLWEIPIPGGESFREAGERFFAAIKRIAEEKTKDGLSSIAVVAHAGVIRAFLKLACGVPGEVTSIPQPYAGITLLRSRMTLGTLIFVIISFKK